MVYANFLGGDEWGSEVRVIVCIEIVGGRFRGNTTGIRDMGGIFMEKGF